MDIEASRETSESLECPFSEVGCCEKLTSRNYEKHLSQNTELHLEMVTKLQSPITSTHQEKCTANGTPLHTASIKNIDYSSELDSLDKLTSVAKEVEYLDRVLNSLGLDYIPALECIKSILSAPKLSINRFGECCTFRLKDFAAFKRSAKTWHSPTFIVNHKYEMQLAVSITIQSNLSVYLLLVGIRGNKDTTLPEAATSIKLPEHIGMRVDLLLEADSCEDNDTESIDEGKGVSLLMTWKPDTKLQLKNVSLIPESSENEVEEEEVKSADIIEAPSMLKMIENTPENQFNGNGSFEQGPKDNEDTFKSSTLDRPKTLTSNSSNKQHSSNSLPSTPVEVNLTNGMSHKFENTSELINTSNGPQDESVLKNHSDMGEKTNISKTTQEANCIQSTPTQCNQTHTKETPLETESKATDTSNSEDVSITTELSYAAGVVLCKDEKFASLSEIKNTVAEYDSLVLQVGLTLM